MGECTNCEKQTTSSSFKYCNECAVKKNECKYCKSPIVETDEKPGTADLNMLSKMMKENGADAFGINNDSETLATLGKLMLQKVLESETTLSEDNVKNLQAAIYSFERIGQILE